ncbi:antirepressor AbbA [Bacillus songklensis]|uniref:Antirepressor AbbA n=1 Tax=Bacillus songklensis TaxID=1069116 RepID=A0ABV8B584_9BACI
MNNNSSVLLSKEEAELLLDLLFEQEYALEVVSSHMLDIETGLKSVDIHQYQKIASLYSRLREM